MFFLIPEATTTSQLKITHLNLYEGPCTGKTEVYMLCDKVQKGNRKVFLKLGSRSRLHKTSPVSTIQKRDKEPDYNLSLRVGLWSFS